LPVLALVASDRHQFWQRMKYKGRNPELRPQQCKHPAREYSRKSDLLRPTLLSGRGVPPTPPRHAHPSRPAFPDLVRRDGRLGIKRVVACL